MGTGSDKNRCEDAETDDAKMPVPCVSQFLRTEAPSAIILAAGKGTRFGSIRPKVLYEVAGRPMLWWVIDACRRAGVQRCIVVVGHEGRQVRQAMADMSGCVFVEQEVQCGTGHATLMSEPFFHGQDRCDVFVLGGDGPLIRQTTLNKLLSTHQATSAAATLATAVLSDPNGYGRVVRADDGGFCAIVEQKDAAPEQLEICEVNPSYYCFSSHHLFSALKRVRNDNKQGEFYLTDVPALLKAQGKTVSVVDAVPPEDAMSINTPEQLNHVDQILRNRMREQN